MIKLNQPCLDCEERNVVCHSRCPKYKQYKKNLKMLKESIKQERVVSMNYISKRFRSYYG